MLEHIETYPETAKTERPELGEKPFIHPGTSISDCKLGSWTEIGANSMLVETVLDDYSYVDGDVSIIYSEIGKFSSIASHVRINPGNHPMKRVTQHHCTYRRVQYRFDDVDDAELFQWRRDNKCVIGHDVWIGHGATVMPGVKIGDGAVVGAGAVVTKDVRPYEIVAGVPAKQIRMRFSEDIIEKLQTIEWWNWERETLEERFNDLMDIESFVDKYYMEE